MNNLIHIALASDDHYFDGLLITAWTIAKYCSRPNDIVFHVLDGGICEGKWATFESKLIHFKCQIDRIRLNSTPRGEMTYARLLLPSLLPNIGHIIYTDVDFLWLIDIAKLWDLIDKDTILQSTPDQRHGQESESAWLHAHGIELPPDNYFCAGLLILNLAKFRSEHLEQQINEFLKKFPHAPLKDQTALNAVIGTLPGAAKMLPGEWQTYARGLHADAFQQPMALHYAGVGPWNAFTFFKMIPDPLVFWFRTYATMMDIPLAKAIQQFLPMKKFLFGRFFFKFIVNLPLAKTLFLFLLRKFRGENTAEFFATILYNVRCPKTIP